MVQTQGTKEWACKNINFSKGCSNSCRYCYARRIANRFGWKKWDDWSNMVNRHEMAKKKFQKTTGMIMSPSSHDITPQNIDLAKQVFTHILEAGNKLLIVSKPDINLIKELADSIEEFKEQVLWRFTIGTLDDKIREMWEPGAPPIKSRLQSLEELYANYWETSVSIEPFLGNDLIDLIDRIDTYITETIWIGPMNKIHVPKEFWTQELTDLYSPKNLSILQREINSLKNPKIRYKDHFLSIASKYISKSKKEPKILVYR